MSDPIDASALPSTPPRAEDHALIEACAGGDASAQRRLVLTYHRPVRQAIGFLSVARSGGVAEADVEDAVQQAFLTFFAHEAQVLRQWAGMSSLRTYLCRIAERIALRHFRRILTRRGRFRLSLDEPAPDGGDRLERLDLDEGPGVDAELVQAEQRERLRAMILERLSEKGRAYYDYLFVQELDVPAIAALEETNANNVYQWKNRIVRLARDILEEVGDGE
ncbi:MAG: sigma-70 family RNA polymerase sigma factor [Myxococcales bacterium]|nr:sigma-70 family RNA polymerase sigma factor [Myxococcales bacterium]MCB9548614.1 sigma-70 family RNA polymerase sigma factor [Myxococcales bacterium]